MLLWMVRTWAPISLAMIIPSPWMVGGNIESHPGSPS